MTQSLSDSTTQRLAMNVIIVNDYANVNGGAARVAILSAQALAAKGVKVHFFAGAGPVSSELEGIEVTCLKQKAYNESSFRRSVFAGLWDREAERQFASTLAEVGTRDTVIHFHSNRDVLSSSVFAPAFKAGVPVVYTCHEYGLTCPYANFFDFEKHDICTRKALSLSCLTAHCNQKTYSRKLWTYTKQSIQNGWLSLPNKLADIIFVSEFSRKIIEPYLGQGRRHVIANPVDAIPGQKRKLVAESPFLFVGSLVPGKDPVLAARAAARVGAPIRFIGDGELREEVLQENPKAVITGWLKPDQVREEMLRARAIVLPARWYETQGLVVQEASAVGVPAVTSRTCAASESIVDGHNGLLIDRGNEDQLMTAMCELMDDQTVCEMGTAAHTHFWKNPPTVEKHVGSLMNIYQGALEHA